jgi:hypothetical protein
MSESRIGRACAVALVGVAVMVPTATAARHFPNCKAVNAVHAHGIAKNRSTRELAAVALGLEGDARLMAQVRGKPTTESR